jgi:hypothetical protein
MKSKRKIPSRKLAGRGRPLRGKGRRLRPMTAEQIREWFRRRQLPLPLGPEQVALPLEGESNGA